MSLQKFNQKSLFTYLVQLILLCLNHRINFTLTKTKRVSTRKVMNHFSKVSSLFAPLDHNKHEIGIIHTRHHVSVNAINFVFIIYFHIILNIVCDNCFHALFNQLYIFMNNQIYFVMSEKVIIMLVVFSGILVL